MAIRGLRKSERRLLWLAFVIVFVIVNAFLWKNYAKRVKTAKNTIAELAAEKENNLAAVEDKAFWDRRQAWLDANMPQYSDRDEAHADWLEYLQESARAHDLDIDVIVLGKPAGGPFHSELSVTVQLDGPEAQMFRWLATMQSPELFQVVKFLKIYRDQSDAGTPVPLAECKVTLARWFRT